MMNQRRVFSSVSALTRAAIVTSALLALSACDEELSMEELSETGLPEEGEEAMVMAGSASSDATVGAYSPKAPGSTANQPRTFNIAALGDSYGSGEGAPFEAGTFDVDGRLVEENGVTHLENWMEGTDTAFAGNCHRSSETGSQLAAEALKAEWGSKVSVDYVNLACSGAAVQHLISQPYAGPEGDDQRDSADMPPQLDQLASHIEAKAWTSLDSVFLSIGGNDALFGSVVTACIAGSLNVTDLTFVDCNNLSDGNMAQLWSDVGDALNRLGGGTGSYAALDDALQGLAVKPANVILSQYPDLSKNDNGTTCTGLDDWSAGAAVDADINGDWLDRIESAEWVFATNNLVTPLNTTIANTASALGWETLVMDAAVTNGRGLCAASGRRLFNQNRDSLNTQGDDLEQSLNFSNGMVHPNKAGQEALYKAPLLTKFRNELVAKLTPTAPKNVHAYAVEASATDGGRNITVAWDDTATSESTFEVKMTKIVSGSATMETGANALNLTLSSTSPSFTYALKSSGVYEISVRACLYNADSSIKACSPYAVGTVANVAPTTVPSVKLSTSGSAVYGTISSATDVSRMFYDIHGASSTGTAYTPFTSEAGGKVLMPFNTSACGSTVKVRSCNLAGCGPYSATATYVCSLGL